MDDQSAKNLNHYELLKYRLSWEGSIFHKRKELEQIKIWV